MQNRIREIRKAKGLTLNALAERANTSQQQIMRLEKGERRLDLGWIEVVAEALGVEEWQLVGLGPPLEARLESLVSKLTRLSPRDLAVIEKMIDGLQEVDTVIQLKK